MADEADYVTRAEGRIREVLADQHAVVALELEARISEAGYADSNLNIDPHHVSTALTNLIKREEVFRSTPQATRGGQKIYTIQPVDQRRRTTAIARAASRKRLLYARYLGWAQGSKRHPHGLIGPAGEQAVRSGILQSAQLIPARPDAGEVKKLLNVDLPGPLDSAGVVVPQVAGIPGQAVTVMIEVKNLRGWIYPHSEEIYQLLYKAVVLQNKRPDQQILPVFICRKAQKPTYWMAQQLGFLVIAMEIQFAGKVEEAELAEVRTELAFSDMRAGSGPSLRVRDRFQDTVPNQAAAYANKWRKTAADKQLADMIRQLRHASGLSRNPLMRKFRDLAKATGLQGF